MADNQGRVTLSCVVEVDGREVTVTVNGPNATNAAEHLAKALAELQEAKPQFGGGGGPG